METPLIVALARQMSVKDHIDVIANNIANMSTTAYRGERVMFKDHLARTSSGQTVVFPQQSGLHRINAPGPISRTANPLDLAIRGDGYFTIETPDGPRYTRDGHFSLDSKGQLVTSAGHPVMDDSNKPFVFGTEVQMITIATDGTVSADDNRLGRIRVVTFEDLQQLKRVGGGLYMTDAAPERAEDADVIQGHLEGSNIQPILEMTRFMRATGHYQQAKKVIDDEHDRQRRAIQMLGSMPE